LGINYLPKPFDVLDLLNAIGHALTTSISAKHVTARKALMGERKLAEEFA
jgi:hypothetical protein